MSKSLKFKNNNYLDSSSIVFKKNNLQEVLKKVGGTNYVLNSKKEITMSKPSEGYNRYVWDLNHPACLKRLNASKQYTLSFKFIPEVEGYSPMFSVVVGGIDTVDAWAIRFNTNVFEVEDCGEYQIWTTSFKIPGDGLSYLQNHIGFILESSASNIGGKIYEIQLEEGFLRTSWRENNSLKSSENISFEANTDMYNGWFSYSTKNGICYLYVIAQVLNPQAGWTWLFGRTDVVPRPLKTGGVEFTASTQISAAPIRFGVQSDGNITCHGGENTGTDYVGTVVYPYED